jgi:hypothetical protein
MEAFFMPLVVAVIALFLFLPHYVNLPRELVNVYSNELVQIVLFLLAVVVAIYNFPLGLILVVLLLTSFIMTNRVEGFQNEDEEMDDENKKKYPRPPYMKVKLDTTYPEAKVKTQVFTSIMKDGKREREKQTVTTVDEFSSVARFLSTIRPIIRPVKGWCEKKVRQGNDYMQYGITFKLIKIEVEPAEGTTNNLSQYMNNDAFIDSDDDETPVQPKKQTSVVSTPVSFSKQKDENEEEEKSESESDEEEEPEPEPEPPKKSKQKPVVRRTKNV